MSAAKHTPGPWHVMKGPDTFIRSESGDNIARICVYGPTSETPWAERENARLIAAAPTTAQMAMDFTRLVEAFLRPEFAPESMRNVSEAELAAAMYELRAHLVAATGAAS